MSVSAVMVYELLLAGVNLEGCCVVYVAEDPRLSSAPSHTCLMSGSCAACASGHSGLCAAADRLQGDGGTTQRTNQIYKKTDVLSS